MEEELINSLVNKSSAVLITIDETGEVIMVTTGELSKDQAIVAGKIITVVGDHSLVLKTVIWIEMIFNRLLIKMKELFK